jgi:S-adenosylmethionine decarboxylase
MQGLHLTADLYDCQCALQWLTDADALLTACEASATAAGLTPVARLGHRFAPVTSGIGGVTVAVLLAESHVCIHTWPETASATLDVYVCNVSANHSARAEELMTRLIALFRPMRVHENALLRGTPPPDTPQAVA